MPKVWIYKKEQNNSWRIINKTYCKIQGIWNSLFKCGEDDRIERSKNDN